MIFNDIEKFSKTIPNKWKGIDCYNEMLTDNNGKQAEWGGFYLEYLMKNFIGKECPMSLRVNEDKSKNNIDLFFNELYADLKLHDLNSNAILGNDLKTVMNILDKDGKIFLIVCNCKSEKDSLYDFETTRYWNKMLGKSNLYSYSKRMKNNITPLSIDILKINNENKKFLKIFNQGKNSDGKPRNPKIKINKKDIDIFLVKKIILVK